MMKRRAFLGGTVGAATLATCKAQSATAIAELAGVQALPEPLVWPIITKLQPGVRSFVGHADTVLDVIGRIGAPPSLVIFTEGNHLMVLSSDDIVGALPAWAKSQPQYANLDLTNIILVTLPQPILVKMIRTGGVALGNLTLDVSRTSGFYPDIFMGYPEPLRQLHQMGVIDPQARFFCKNRGVALLVRKGNPLGIRGSAVAQEMMEQARSPMVANSTVLTVEQEKAKAAEPGSEFKECASGCPAMIVIPAGKFMMGSPENEPDRDATEGPRHEVTVAEPFAVSKFEVSFEEWDACVAAARCPDIPDQWGRGRMPVINVSWRDAKQYVAWLSELTQKEYRLLTEAEWEYAARAGTVTRYFWGDDPRGGNANCNGCGSSWDLQQTAPVGSLKPNAFGLYDMLGNVWEWVEDPWHENYYDAPIDASAWLTGGDPDYRVIRGGSWRNESELVRTAVRVDRNIHVRFDTLGLRIARTMNR